MLFKAAPESFLVSPWCLSTEPDLREVLTRRRGWHAAIASTTKATCASRLTGRVCFTKTVRGICALMNVRTVKRCASVVDDTVLSGSVRLALCWLALLLHSGILLLLRSNPLARSAKSHLVGRWNPPALCKMAETLTMNR